MEKQTLYSKFPNRLIPSSDLTDGYDAFIRNIIGTVNLVEIAPLQRIFGITKYHQSKMNVADRPYATTNDVIYLPINSCLPIDHVFLHVIDHYYDDDGLMFILYNIGFQYRDGVVLYDTRRHNTFVDDIDKVVLIVAHVRIHSELIEQNRAIINFNEVFVTLEKNVPVGFNHYPAKVVEETSIPKPVVQQEIPSVLELRLSGMIRELEHGYRATIQQLESMVSDLQISNSIQRNHIIELVNMNKTILSCVQSLVDDRHVKIGPHHPAPYTQKVTQPKVTLWATCNDLSWLKERSKR